MDWVKEGVFFMQKYGKLISVFLIIMMLGSCLSGCGAAAGTGAEGSTVSSTNTEAAVSYTHLDVYKRQEFR